MFKLKLGHLCTTVGLTSDLLKADGPFPSIGPEHITNGLVFELVRFAKISKLKLPLSRVCTWINSFQHLSNTTPENLLMLTSQRDEYRRLKQTQNMAILECKEFRADDWQPPNEHAADQLQEVTQEPPLKPAPRHLHYQSNQLSHEINKKEKHVQRLRSEIEEEKENLRSVRKSKGVNCVRNINKRIKRVQGKNKELEDLKKDNAALKNLVEELKDDKIKLQKCLWKLKQKVFEDGMELEETCPECERAARNLKDKEEEIKYLESKIAEKEEIKLKDERGFIKTAVRVCVLELASHEVGTAKIGLVIQSVARNIFGVELSDVQLPKRAVCTNIVNEGGEIIKSIVARRLEKDTARWGLHKDGTSRKKQHILDTTVHLDSGEDFTLGFSRVESETGQAIQEEAVTKIEELAPYAESPVNFLTKAASGLQYFMSDRAANEKKSNILLNEWRASMANGDEDNKKEVEGLFCMAHVLLGLHNYSLKYLAGYQKDVSDDGSGRLGRDGVSNFYGSHYKTLQAASRVCMGASDVFAPVGDHLGIRNIWESYCKDQAITSTIKNYKDNRFNGLFEVSAAVTEHYADFVKVLRLHVDSSSGQPNSKIKGLLLDLEDPEIMTIINVLAACFTKITGPFWHLVTTNPYNKVCKVVRQLHREVKHLVDNPRELFNAHPLLSLQAHTSKRHNTIISFIGENKSNLNKCVTTVMDAFLKCMKTQLADVIGRKKEVESCSFAPATNLNVERNFGLLDASWKRRPNSGIRFQSSFISIKKHRDLIGVHLQTMTIGRQKIFMSKIRKISDQISSKYRRRNDLIRQNILNSAQMRQQTKAKNRKRKAVHPLHL